MPGTRTEFAGQISAGLAGADADDVGVGRNTQVADVYVAAARGEVVTRLIPQRDVIAAARVVEKRLVTVGGIGGAVRVPE